MMNAEVQESIVKNISEFNSKERKEFMKYLIEETTDTIDLNDMFNVKNKEDYWNLDTAVREYYTTAFMKMHIRR